MRAGEGYVLDHDADQPTAFGTWWFHSYALANLRAEYIEHGVVSRALSLSWLSLSINLE